MMSQVFFGDCNRERVEVDISFRELMKIAGVNGNGGLN